MGWYQALKAQSGTVDVSSAAALKPRVNESRRARQDAARSWTAVPKSTEKAVFGVVNVWYVSLIVATDFHPAE